MPKVKSPGLSAVLIRTLFATIALGLAVSLLAFVAFVRLHFRILGVPSAMLMLALSCLLLLRILLRSLAQQKQGESINLVPRRWERAMLCLLPAVMAMTGLAQVL